MAIGRHQGGLSEDRRPGLADGDHVGAPTDMVQHAADRVDIVRQTEASRGDGNIPGIGPVGDIDVEIGEERRDRAAQQGRVMARERRDDQQRGPFHVRAGGGETLGIAPEMAQLHPGGPPGSFHGNRHRMAANRHLFDSPGGLAIATGHIRHHIGRGEKGAAHIRLAGRIEGRAPEMARDLRAETQGGGHAEGRFMKRVKHPISEQGPASSP